MNNNHINTDPSPSDPLRAEESAPLDRTPLRDETSDATEPIAGDFIAASDVAYVGAASTNVRDAFDAAEARIRSAHRAVAGHIDGKFAQRIQASVNALGRANPDEREAARQMAQSLRNDMTSRQRKNEELLVGKLQQLVAGDIDAAAEVSHIGSSAAASALRGSTRSSDRSPT